jgi:hypothetical protein
MCLAGDGGGKGSRRKRLAGAGDAAAEEPKRWCAGLGLGVENGKKGDDAAQCCGCFVGVAAAAEYPGGSDGVAGAARGGEWSASCVSGFAWHPPIVLARARDLAGGWADAVAEELGGWGGHGGKREREWRVGTG